MTLCLGFSAFTLDMIKFHGKIYMQDDTSYKMGIGFLLIFSAIFENYFWNFSENNKTIPSFTLF